MLNRRQAIIWTNGDPIHWRIYEALGGDELTHWPLGYTVVIFRSSHFQTHIKDRYREHFPLNCSEVNATRPPRWSINIGWLGHNELKYGWCISKFHNVPIFFPTMHHSEQKCAHLCSEWWIVGYEMHCGICETALLQHDIVHNIQSSNCKVELMWYLELLKDTHS